MFWEREHLKKIKKDRSTDYLVFNTVTVIMCGTINATKGDSFMFLDALHTYIVSCEEKSRKLCMKRPHSYTYM